jgi:hypothetical protein
MAGLAWVEIAAMLPGRTSDQVRMRFLNVIDPSLKKNVAWTVEEDRVVNCAQLEMGNKWTQIAKLLPGRSENDVKNRWHNAKTKTSRMMKSLTVVHKRRAMLASLRNPVTHTTISMNGGGLASPRETASRIIQPETAEV